METSWTKVTIPTCSQHSYYRMVLKIFSTAFGYLRDRLCTRGFKDAKILEDNFKGALV